MLGQRRIALSLSLTSSYRIDISMVAPNPLGFLVDDMFTLTFTTPDSDDQALAQELMDTAGTFEFV